MTAWFAGLGTTVKTLMALGILAAASATVGLGLGGWSGLPAKVNVNTAAITEIRASSSSLERKVDRIICILQLPEGGSPLGCP